MRPQFVDRFGEPGLLPEVLGPGEQCFVRLGRGRAGPGVGGIGGQHQVGQMQRLHGAPGGGVGAGGLDERLGAGGVHDVGGEECGATP